MKIGTKANLISICKDLYRLEIDMHRAIGQDDTDNTIEILIDEILPSLAKISANINELIGIESIKHIEGEEMKQIRFDAKFEEAILKGEKVATIRNDKKVDVGDDFILVDENNVHIAEAECVGVLRIEVKELFSALYPMHDYIDSFLNLPISLKNSLPIRTDIYLHKIGFDRASQTLEFYKTYLKNEHCYLHIFELIKES